MPHWWKKFSGLRTSEQRQWRRTARRLSGPAPLQLEDRLVLGSLSPLPASPESTDFAAAGDPQDSVLQTAYHSDQLIDADAARSDPPTDSRNSTWTTAQRSAKAITAPPPASLVALPPLVEDELSHVTAISDVPAVALATSSSAEPGGESAVSSALIEDSDEPPSIAPESPLPIEASLHDASEGVLVDAETFSTQSGRLPVSEIPWFDETADPVLIKYDFRAHNGTANEITDEQIAIVEQTLAAWSEATNHRINWVRDVDAADDEVVVIGVGNLSAVGLTSAAEGLLGVAGSRLIEQDGQRTMIGAVWLDHAENWDLEQGNGDPVGTVDFFTVMAHETGHVLGLADTPFAGAGAVMNPGYTGERSQDAIAAAMQNAVFFPADQLRGDGLTGYSLHGIMMGFPQLSQLDVQGILNRASAFSNRNDAIIAVVDRNGTILGIRAEQDVLDNFAGDPAGLAFAIDGAVSKARTAAYFANSGAPLTSRLVRFISQSTVTQREVEGNPNDPDPNSTTRGPGFVAPIGLGGHFPPDIAHTPPVDLFGIEHTNRDNRILAGPDGLLGTFDDTGRFNIDPALIPAGQNIVAPLSYGTIAGLPGDFTSRGIATMPGGVPIYRDTDGDGVGDTLIGGIGVFYPGPDGYATFEQGFEAGVGQTTNERFNSDLALEAELTAFMAVGGSLTAQRLGAPGAKNSAVTDLDIPFGNISLVGINLQLFGPTAGIVGVQQLVQFGRDNVAAGATSGAVMPLAGGAMFQDGYTVPDGHLVTPHDSAVDNLTAADVNQIIDAGVAAAEITRAAIRLRANNQPGARTSMVFAITDTTGEVLGLYRMEDATVFSIDVAVAKARNVAYYADATALQPQDQVPGIDPGVAFSNRTFRFIAEPRFPDGVDGTPPPPFSILRDALAANIDPLTGENLGAPAAASVFQSVLGYDAFNPGTNFRDPDNPENQNGIVFFPGSTPLYKNGVLVGGLGVSGDGVDQDDVVTFLAASGFLPDGVTIGRADQEFVGGVRLPFQKFLRDPFG